VHEDVPEARHAAHARHEVRRQDGRLSEQLDHLAIGLGGPELLGCHQVAADIEHALDGQLEAVLDRPLRGEIVFEHLMREAAGELAQLGDVPLERVQAPAERAPVDHHPPA
jgi:hypothetical protein